MRTLLLLLFPLFTFSQIKPKVTIVKGKLIPIGPMKSFMQVRVPARHDYKPPSPDTSKGLLHISNERWEDFATFTKVDSIGAQWKQEVPGEDSATVVRGLLDAMTSNVHFSDSLRKRSDSVATRWLNICRWMCRDYGITQQQLMELIQKHSYIPANINDNKRKKFKS